MVSVFPQKRILQGIRVSSSRQSHVSECNWLNNILIGSLVNMSSWLSMSDSCPHFGALVTFLNHTWRSQLTYGTSHTTSFQFRNHTLLPHSSTLFIFYSLSCLAYPWRKIITSIKIQTGCHRCVIEYIYIVGKFVKCNNVYIRRSFTIDGNRRNYLLLIFKYTTNEWM